MKILALDIGGTAIKAGIFRENGIIDETTEYQTNRHEGGQKLMERILEITNSYRGIDRIGISATGQIDSASGSVIYGTDSLPGWPGTRIKELIEKSMGVHVAVENDANAAALGEAYYGSGRGIPDFLCLTYGTGVGGAIIQSGRIYRGSSGSAAEFGHIITHVGGRKCMCGGYGCYEEYASATVLCKNVAEALGIKEIDGREVFRLLSENNADVKKQVDGWINEVVTGLVSLVYIFNPSCIILGGGVMSQPYIIDAVEKSLPSHVMPSFRKLSVKKASLGNLAGLYGAMHSVMNLD